MEGSGCLQPQTAHDAASSAQTTFVEPIETIDSVPGKWQMPQVTSRPGSSYIRLGLGKPQRLKPIPYLQPSPMPDSSPIQESMYVEPVSFHPFISRPKLITIKNADSDEDMVTTPASPE